MSIEPTHRGRTMFCPRSPDKYKVYRNWVHSYAHLNYVCRPDMVWWTNLTFLGKIEPNLVTTATSHSFLLLLNLILPILSHFSSPVHADYYYYVLIDRSNGNYVLICRCRSSSSLSRLSSLSCPSDADLCDIGWMVNVKDATFFWDPKNSLWLETFFQCLAIMNGRLGRMRGGDDYTVRDWSSTQHLSNVLRRFQYYSRQRHIHDYSKVIRGRYRPLWGKI